MHTDSCKDTEDGDYPIGLCGSAKGGLGLVTGDPISHGPQSITSSSDFVRLRNSIAPMSLFSDNGRETMTKPDT